MKACRKKKYPSDLTSTETLSLFKRSPGRHQMFFQVRATLVAASLLASGTCRMRTHTRAAEDRSSGLRALYIAVLNLCVCVRVV